MPLFFFKKKPCIASLNASFRLQRAVNSKFHNTFPPFNIIYYANPKYLSSDWLISPAIVIAKYPIVLIRSNLILRMN